MLATLELVDYVAVVEGPTAVPAIEAVRPDIYVKGGEYENASDDITGMIDVERAAVEENGGRVVFTHEETYSSTRLLNRHFGKVGATAREYLQRGSIQAAETSLAELLEVVAGMKIAVVGEVIIDHYVYVEALGKAAKENIIATLRRDEEIFAGGAIAAAGHLASFCENVDVISVIGAHDALDEVEQLINEALPESVSTSFVRRGDAPTVRKTRFVEPTYVRKLFEVYDMNDQPLDDENRKELHERILDKCSTADLTIVCDFGHGLINDETVGIIESLPGYLAVNSQSNAGNIGFNLVTKYNRADLVCIDALEARLATSGKHEPLAELVGQLRHARPNWDNIIVTDGSRGCIVSEGGNSETIQIPAISQDVVDTIGAGDAFFVISSALLAAGASCELAGFLGNIAGAIKIGIVGHRRPLEKIEVQRYLTTLLK